MADLNMDTTIDALERVNRSYGRCCVSTGFFDTFYDLFLKSSPEIPPMFTKTDFAKQKQLLRSGIAMLILFSKGSTISKATVERLGHSHDKTHLNIRPSLYPLWVTSLMAAVKKHDAQYSPALEKDWREELQKGIDKMSSFY